MFFHQNLQTCSFSNFEWQCNRRAIRVKNIKHPYSETVFAKPAVRTAQKCYLLISGLKWGKWSQCVRQTDKRSCPLALPRVLFSISWGGGDRVDFTETARWYQKHDSRCLHAQLTTHSSGLVEKVALVFQIEIGNQLATFNSGGKENKDVEKRSNTNKQSNNCSNSDMWSPWCYKITTEGLCLSEKLARFALSV